jgi:hypothetical protein
MERRLLNEPRVWTESVLERIAPTVLSVLHITVPADESEVPKRPAFLNERTACPVTVPATDNGELRTAFPDEAEKPVLANTFCWVDNEPIATMLAKHESVDPPTSDSAIEATEETTRDSLTDNDPPV